MKSSSQGFDCKGDVYVQNITITIGARTTTGATTAGERWVMALNTEDNLLTMGEFLW